MRKLFYTLMCLFVFLLPCHLFAQELQQKGKIVIVILDISGSIRSEFPAITKILDKSIIQDRLSVGDYFVLIAFGDKATPVYSGQLLRIEDKTSISNALHMLKPDNNYTDIGQALQDALNQIISLKKQNFNLYEPLVLFITDGDITTDPKSLFHNKKVGEIFKSEPFNELPLYNGWYYVGIGKDLHDLPEIATLSGRKDNVLRIEDLDKLNDTLGGWVQNIPASRSLEIGTVIPKNFLLSKKPILQKDELNKYQEVAMPLDNFSFDLVSSYEKTNVICEISSCDAVFQSKDLATIVPLTVNFPVGKMQIMPLSSNKVDCTIAGEGDIHGCGTLTVNMVIKTDGIDAEYPLVFNIDAKTQKELLISRLFLPVVILLGVLIIIVAIIIARKFAPVSVIMEVVGKVQKARPVAIKVGGKMPFGSKMSNRFKIESSEYDPIVGMLYRKGCSKWCITKVALTAFEKEFKGDDYKFGTPIKIKGKNGLSISIKFRQKR